MGRSHRRMSSLKLSGSPRIDRATSSSSVHVMRSAEGSLSQSVRRWTAAVWLEPQTDFVQYISKSLKSFLVCWLRLNTPSGPACPPVGVGDRSRYNLVTAARPSGWSTTRSDAPRHTHSPIDASGDGRCGVRERGGGR